LEWVNAFGTISRHIFQIDTVHKDTQK